jgi:ABC-type phosphate transport system auxiliary subunit
MNKINDFITKNYQKIVFILLFAIFLNTCGNPTKPLNKRVDTLSQKIDSLQNVSVTKKDLTLEGLRVEKRMIQSTDRKILDVNRQAEIDKEIQKLEK